MSIELSEFFKDCSKQPPISQEQVGSLAEKLPESYIELLQFSDGVEGTVSNGSYLQLWKAADLDERNKDLKAKESVPDMYLVGSNGGDEGIGIDLRKDSGTYGSFYRVPFIPLDWKEAVLLGPKVTDIKTV